jgi:TolA-binding protein
VEHSAGRPPDRPRPDEPVTPATGVPEEEQPATRGELRTLRRWLAVAGVWAVAATAIAIIALLDKDESSDAGARDSAAQVSRVQRELDRRLDDLEEQVRDLPRSDDLRKLEGRLQQSEEQASGASEDASRADDKAGDVERRVEDLERQVDDLQQGGGGAAGPNQGQP